jgi:hypothetical protein
MTETENKIKLDEVLCRLGMDTSVWVSHISNFRKKLELLSNSKRYDKLLRTLFSSNDINEFNSYVFEVLFAYDFESNGRELVYEIKQVSESNSSIDFCYSLDNRTKLYFELRLIKQRERITQSMESQLKNRGSYEILLDGSDERSETVRLQNLILGKCQDENGKPIKFREAIEEIFNFIVVDVSELHLTMVDEGDCYLAMYGDAGVPVLYRRGVFGLCQQMQKDSEDKENKYYQKFQHFRETIHGAMFVKHVKNGVHLNNLYIDRELEYYLVGNNNLLQEKEFNLIDKELSSFLKKWTKR